MVYSGSQKLKLAAVEQWTADPCGEHRSSGSAGTREYFDGLMRMRREESAWMSEVLGYSAVADLEVLDVGCGQGLDVANYALGGAAVTGVDLTPRHVELARSHIETMGLTADIVEGDAEALPFATGSFDRVSSNGVLHHTPDMPRALSEMHRVLRSGGECRIIVYNRNSLHYWLHQVLVNGLFRGLLFRERTMTGVLATEVEYSSIGARPLVRVLSPRQVRRMLQEAGFTAVDSQVRHFAAHDMPITAVFAPRLSWLRKQAVLDRIGRVAGWYVVAVGTK